MGGEGEHEQEDHSEGEGNGYEDGGGRSGCVKQVRGARRQDRQVYKTHLVINTRRANNVNAP